ncbi:hypothetical protein [Pseudoalteromonas porphyrae]|uniref:Uncharacterized protein n=1 Tax=Pseudoalteromonas porphyrae TaxID=187330 RepID=A0A0N0M1M8_9GAMM|nr:hypothetical protein [Pseudoalteromonas porphyrae]KPH65398.1 hypothetical protein ADS77_00170 [Pseudoalteromonas porphyrae]
MTATVKPFFNMGFTHNLQENPFIFTGKSIAARLRQSHHFLPVTNNKNLTNWQHKIKSLKLNENKNPKKR